MPIAKPPNQIDKGSPKVDAGLSEALPQRLLEGAVIAHFFLGSKSCLTLKGSFYLMKGGEFHPDSGSPKWCPELHRESPVDLSYSTL
jgi:hypothetical protein